MKPRLKHTSLVVLAGVGLFISCTKPEVPQRSRISTSSPTQPSPTGQEFLFDSLTWIFYDGRFDVGVDYVYLETPRRADLFASSYTTYINAEVLLKFDTASNWIVVKSIDLYDPVIPVQYMYWIYLNSLFVEIRPLHYQLIGRKATLKVKFL